MPISEAQRAQRATRIGSSDSPAILEVDPWRSPHDVYLSKIHELDEIEDNDAIDIGNTFEAPLLAWAAKELGVKIEENAYREHANGIMAANHDALIVGKRWGLEAKTTSQPDEWGEEGTDQVPNRVIVQAHHQMACADLELVYVPVLFARFDRLTRAMYRIERNDQIVKAIEEADVDFWNSHVLPRVPASTWTPSLDVAKRIRRTPGVVATVDDVPDMTELVAAYELAASTAKEADKDKTDAQARLLAAIGEAEAIDFNDAKKWYTYFEQSRTSIDSKKLKAEHPDLFEKFSKTSTFRVLRLANKPK